MTDGNAMASKIPIANANGVQKKLASPVELACVWLYKAQAGSVSWSNDCDEEQLKYWHLRKRLRPLKHVLYACYLGVAFVEEPGWCVAKRDVCPRSTDWYLDLVGMPQAQVFVVPFMLHSIFKCLLLSCMFYRTWLLKKSRGSTFVWTKWRILKLACLTVAFFDFAVIMFNESGIIPGSIRLQRLLRPVILLSAFKPLRETAAYIFRAVPQFASMIVCLFVTVVMFSWVGLILFQNTEEGEEHFFCMSAALSNMYILFTTSNSPDAFIPAYNESRCTFIFFLIYLLISLYLFQSLIVASVYDGYKDYLKDGLREFYKNRRIAVCNAFELLAEVNDNGAQVISRDTWFSFYLCHRSSFQPLWPCASAASNDLEMTRAMAIYEVCQEAGDADQGLTIQRFRCLIEMLQDDNIAIDETEDRSTVSPEFRVLRASMRKFILDGIKVTRHVTIYWDNLLDMLICGDLVVTAYASVSCVTNRNGFTFAGGFWNNMAIVLTLLYWVELHLKLHVLGFARFRVYDGLSMYDLVNVYLLVVAEVVFWLTEETDVMIRLYMIAHMARYIRLVFYLKPFQELTIFLKKLLPTYNKLGALLLVSFFIYAEVGQQAFGGIIHSGEPKLDGTDYAENSYWDLNFNDFPGSLVVLFVIMVVNNWMIISEAYWVMTESYWSQAYFISFYMIMNLVVLNILMAFIIECFQTLGGELLETDNEEHKPRQAMLRKESVLRQVMMGDGESDEMTAGRSTKAAREVVNNKLAGGVRKAAPKPGHRGELLSPVISESSIEMQEMPEPEMHKFKF